MLHSKVGVYRRLPPYWMNSKSLFQNQAEHQNCGSNVFAAWVPRKISCEGLVIGLVTFSSWVSRKISCERVGDWACHLLIITRMLNLFAAFGRINYAKSARLYLQSMNELPEKHPWLYQCFNEKGYHVVRRSVRYWGGLWSDLIIEQVLMRSIKSRRLEQRKRYERQCYSHLVSQCTV